ncbi:hypothetical protein KIK06_29150 [Nocardiopsis sp. EMB25]|uniref:hypothetical protein n=1 Tax=Nocardiopsis sp. EMB25 TaxID=2835867 RepID=UPI002284B4F8|nr:hypothetical protein [Nocardiopsis sp. EMB25]MCY9787952.1 hypothetical protein [Nocardiopsis sp. EMB25]
MPEPTQVHLLIRTSDAEETWEIAGALTHEEQASLLMQTREEFESRDDVSYEIQTIQVHPTAAAVLGLDQ